MPRYVKKYINSITESNILKVYTSEDNSQIKVFFKIANEEIDRIFSGQEVVKFLNQTTNIRDHENKSAISKNVEQGIIRDVEGIHRENGRYVYKSDLLAEEQYRELFDSRQAIKFNLNDFMSDSISKIVHLRSRFEGILGFDSEEGLCQPLIYFITLLGLKSREDFAKLLKSGDVVSEQDFIAYVDGRKEQTTGLLATQILLQFLPILHIQSIERREGDQFYDKTIYEQECNDLSSTEVWIHINQEKVKCALDNVEIECCLEFNFSCYTCNEGDSDDDDENIAHSMLVYKAENGKYIFFDPNRGAVGFCPNTGVANFTSEEVCRAVELAVNFYSYNMYIENSPDYCEIYVTLRNATLMLRKAEELYETRERTNSKIVDISVDNNTGKLLLTPINL